jgi:hypothetical protein
MIGDVNSVTMQLGIVTATVLSTISYQKYFNYYEAHFDSSNHDRSNVLWLGLDLSRRIIVVSFTFVLQEDVKSFMIADK